MQVKAMENRWQKTTREFEAPAALLQSVFSDVIAPYHTDSHRAYHNFTHIAHLLDLIETHGAACNVDPITLNLVAWFHDIIYNPKKKNNEEKSAQIAEQWLPKMGIETTVIEHVAHIIRRTANHTQNTANDSRETLFFLDADLGILGSEPAGYEAYHQAIRQEYKHVPSLLYKPGRRKVLAQFVNAEFIFRTEPFRTLYETKARQNLTAEIALLR
jgi:predicted metal-dependent HD superfamily phosphohydrolase